MWAGAAMGFVATGPFIIHFWCRADLPLAHERHRGGVARRADRRDLSLAHGRTDFLGASLWQGTVRITLTSLDTLFVWSHCGGVYLDDAGKCEARRCADVFVQADMPRNGGGYTIRRSTRCSVGMPRLGRTPRLGRGGLIAMTEVGAGVYAGLRCADCAFSEFVLNEESGMFVGTCSRGYTLADPHVHVSPDRFFAKNPRALVPVTDPYGREYLRTRNICTRFTPREG